MFGSPVLLAYPTSDPKQIRVTAEGFMGKAEMLLPLTLGTFAECWEKRVKGDLIQNAFPMLTKEQREFLITGMNMSQQDVIFNEGEEDDADLEDGA